MRRTWVCFCVLLVIYSIYSVRLILRDVRGHTTAAVRKKDMPAQKTRPWTCYGSVEELRYLIQNDRVNFQTKKSNREDTALRNTHFLIIELRETWTYPHLKVPALKKTFNKRRSHWVEIATCVWSPTYGPRRRTSRQRSVTGHVYIYIYIWRNSGGRKRADPKMLEAKWVCEWVSSFLAAHQHIIGHSVPQMVDNYRMST